MDSVTPTQGGRFTAAPPSPEPRSRFRPSLQGANTVTASQARAARRREARRDELAVSAWLRELSARGR